MGTRWQFFVILQRISDGSTLFAGWRPKCLEISPCRKEMVDSQAAHAISEDTQSLITSRKVTL